MPTDPSKPLPYTPPNGKRVNPSSYPAAHDQQWMALERIDTRLDEFARAFSNLRDDVQANKSSIVAMEREHTASVSDCKSEMATLHAMVRAEQTTGVESAKTMNAKFDAGYKSLEARISALLQPNWTKIGFIVGSVPAIATAFWIILQMQITVAMTPVGIQMNTQHEMQLSRNRIIDDLTKDVTALQADSSGMKQSSSVNAAKIGQIEDEVRRTSQMALQSAASDEQSRTDRRQLNERIRTTEELAAATTAQRREQIAALRANQVEIETQFKNTEQFISLIWEKLFGSRFPSDITRQTPAQP